MNTPEQLINNNINRTQTQYVQNYNRPLVQARDYAKILRDHNTPAQWYKPTPRTHSIYFYDPTYQRYLQQQSNTTTHSCSNPTTCRVKPIVPSRLQTVPRLPRITTNKKT